MRYIFLPVAFFIGLFSAYFMSYTHGVLLILLPLATIAFGYFFSWRLGLLFGFFVFLGFSFPYLIPWEGRYRVQQFLELGSVFLRLGLPICLVGTLAPLVRRGLRRPEAVVALVALMLTVSYFVYPSVPRGEHTYYISIFASENPDDLELYLPVVIDSGELDVDLYDSTGYRPPCPTPLFRGGPVDLSNYDRATLDYSYELVDTEYGKMLKLRFQNLVKVNRMLSPTEGVDLYIAEVCFGEARGVDIIPREPRLEPSYDGEEPQVPIRVCSHEEVEVQLMLSSEYRKSLQSLLSPDSHPIISRLRETVEFDGVATNEWILVPIKVEVKG